MKSTLSFIFLVLSFAGVAQIPQPTDSLPLYGSGEIDVYPKAYMHQYNQLKKVIVKVYPYALHAADVLDEINNNMAAIEKRRQQNKYTKDAYKDLRDEFKYAFLELYTSEGIMLMKLVHRETGLTVYEIAERYRGKDNAEMFELMGKLWNQNLKIKYDPTGVDKIAEHVIRDIQSGLIPFSDDPLILNKEEFKIEQQKDRERQDQAREREKQKKKKLREKEREARKLKRQQD